MSKYMFTDIRSSCCQGQFYSLRHGGDQQLMLYYSLIKHTGDKNNLEFITKNEEILILSNSLSNYMYHHRYERTVKKHDCGYWAVTCLYHYWPRGSVLTIIIIYLVVWNLKQMDSARICWSVCLFNFIVSGTNC